MRGNIEKAICAGCSQPFNVQSIKIRSGKGKFCNRSCYNNYRLLNKKDNKYLNKLYQKKNKYGVNEQDYLNLMKITNCQICDKELTENKHKCIDHCHTTGIIRGVLCNNCNRGLGHFADNISNLQLAIQYLLKKQD